MKSCTRTRTGSPLGCHSALAKRADELLFLRIHGDDRRAAALKRVDPIIDELELRIPIRMVGPFDRLLGCLQTVPAGVQQLTDLLRTDGVALRRQLGRELAGALRRPAQGRFGVAAGHRIDQPFQRLDDLRRRRFEPGPATTRSTNGDDIVGAHARSQLTATGTDRRAREAGRAFHDRDPSVAQCVRLRARPQARQALIHHRVQRQELRSNGCFVIHHGTRSRSQVDSLVDPLVFPSPAMRLRTSEQLVSARAHSVS